MLRDLGQRFNGVHDPSRNDSPLRDLNEALEDDQEARVKKYSAV
jgi:hypothetical protein